MSNPKISRQKSYKKYGTMKRSNLQIIGTEEGEETQANGTELFSTKITQEISPILKEKGSI